MPTSIFWEQALRLTRRCVESTKKTSVKKDVEIYLQLRSGNHHDVVILETVLFACLYNVFTWLLINGYDTEKWAEEINFLLTKWKGGV
jgi:hypothetical protein